MRTYLLQRHVEVPFTLRKNTRDTIYRDQSRLPTRKNFATPSRSRNSRGRAGRASANLPTEQRKRSNHLYHGAAACAGPERLIIPPKGLFTQIGVTSSRFHSAAAAARR